MNTNKILWIFTLSAAMLVGCTSGGGGGEADIDPTLGEAQPENPDNGPVTPPVASVQTADLQADANFDFATSWDMDVTFALPQASGFLSLCTDYVRDESLQPTVNFESCIVRTPIAESSYQAQAIPMTNEITSLIAVLIDYSNPSQPLYVEFPITVGQGSLNWEQGTTL